MYQILIANGEKIECHLLSLILKKHFPNLTVLPYALNFSQLTAALETHSPHIAVIDLHLPGSDILETLKEIHLQHTDMHILLTSDYSEFQHVKRAMSLSKIDYILKPVQPQDLIHAVSKICADLDQKQNLWKRHFENSSAAFVSLETEKEDFLSDIVCGKISPQNAMNLLQNLKSPYRGGIFMTFRPAPSPNLPITFPWQNYAHALTTQISHLCTCFGKPYQRDFILCLLPGMSFEQPFYQNWVFELFQTALQKADPSFRCPLLFGVSSVKLNLSDLTDAFRESIIALEHKTEPGFYFF